MWEYNYSNPDVLCHYGVKGMKWGRRKANYTSITTDGSKRRAYDNAQKRLETARANKKVAQKVYNKSFNKATSLRGAYGKNSKANVDRMMEAAKASNKADRQYKAAKQAAKAAKKMAKIEASVVKTKYREQYMKGQSAVGKAMARLTNADKHYADAAYEANKGAYREKW